MTRTVDSKGSSGASTPCESPSLGSIDEKGEDFGRSLGSSFVEARQFTGRPDIVDAISKTVSESTGTSLVVGESFRFSLSPSPEDFDLTLSCHQPVDLRVSRTKYDMRLWRTLHRRSA